MITKISMNKVKSYKNTTILTTDKKINLIYGLNGAGKSVLSDYLYDRTQSEFSACSIEGMPDNDEIFVYNQHFINDYFYQPENLKCIFTLSKENKEAQEKIKNANETIEKLKKENEIKNTEIINEKNNRDTKKENAENKTWEIKTKYSGGDRVLEFCLDTLRGDKEKLFKHIERITKPDQQTLITIEQLKKEAEQINSDTAKTYDMLPQMSATLSEIEMNEIIKKSILGNENSTVATLINKLGNPDWVKDGLGFISQNPDDNNQICPFCQERTISKTLLNNIKSYFDDTYKNDINEINKLLSDYEYKIQSLPKKDIYESNPIINERKSDFDSLYNTLFNHLNINKEKIKEKYKTPSQIIYLEKTDKIITDFNNFIDEINNLVIEHNYKIENKGKTREKIKIQFWDNMRWEYDQTISAYHKEREDIERKLKYLLDEQNKINEQILNLRKVISEQNNKTKNIQEAIDNINDGLIELGIDGFYVKKHSDTLYKIVRDEKCNNTFGSLSEGEKMVISFLYFRELYKGKKSATVVIDDPISSLSHIYIFNIAQMIKNDFYNSSNYEQVFILTHSLYFFYEMTIKDNEKREEKQNLFRLFKNENGSQIFDMKYNDIQNDYHVYWSVIKDNTQPGALIANCMRNIIEYFFGFVEKKDCNNVFQKSELKAIRFQAFCRYINRESHSDAKNIFDIKEFNYDDFKEAFKLVFVQSGYPEHYNEMMK